jgi:uncharacterized protein
MRVVSNTSPLSNLAIIGHLGLVREQLGTLLIPPAVRAELLRNPHAEARLALEAAVEEGWILVRRLAGAVPPIFAARLDLGEAEALALALETRSPLVLLDESAARLQARQLGLTFTGVLGLLRQAKRTGRISCLKEQINRLRAEARFFVGPALERALLISVEEC